MTCQWCGEPHAVDRLCQRAQRGLTRRSFCFLFGAGLAASALPVPAWVTDLLRPIQIPFNKSTRIVDAINRPTTATFRPQDPYRPSLGQEITIAFQGLTLFSGTIDQIDTMPDGAQEVHATDPSQIYRVVAAESDNFWTPAGWIK